MTTVGLVACAPLEQAPLVYSSKNQIGVGVSAGTPDSPGLDITIGYKGLDAAYVPVAVSKPCQEDKNCTNELRLISGGNKASDSEIADRSTIALKRDKIERLESSIITNRNAIAELESVEKSLSQIEEIRSKKISDLTKRITNDGSEQDKILIVEKENFEKEIVRLNLLNPNNLTKQDISDLITSKRSKNKIDESNIENLSADIKLIESQLDRSSNNTKQDAYSVFGSFTGNANANVKPSGGEGAAGLSLGRLFSTGVAAQFLSEKVGDSYLHGQRSMCVEKFEKTAEKQTDPAVAEKIMSGAIAFCKGSAK